MSSWTDEDEDGGTHPSSPPITFMWEGGDMLGTDAGYGCHCPTFQG